jgi:hypothetical protein
MHSQDEAPRPKGWSGPAGRALALTAALLCGCTHAQAPSPPETRAGGAEGKSSLVTFEEPIRVECLDPEGRIFYEDMRQVLEIFDDLSRRVYVERAGGELLSGRPADHLTCRFVPLEAPPGRADP